jgi:HD-GYP domain-containing protein (c-di-GMP phosphodiesterase class II)
MAVADVFTAITEDRPYRKGMPNDSALHVLQQMADNSALDSNIVSLLKLHLDDISSFRIAAQAASVEEYQEIATATRLIYS